jgi:hypothetical protein
MIKSSNIFQGKPKSEGMLLVINVDDVKKNYPKGTRIKLIAYGYSFTSKKEGLLGTVVLVDDFGTIHMEWDDGSSVGLIVGEDQFTIL